MIRFRTRRGALGVAIGAIIGLVAAAPAPPAAAGGTADGVNVVVHWDQVAQVAIWDVGQQLPWSQARAFAMVDGAVYDAVNAIAGTPYQPYLGALPAKGTWSMDAAVASAAYQVLVELFPDQQASLRASYDETLATVRNGPAKRGGVAVGARAAARMIAARRGDGAFGDQTWTVGTQPGQWRPTPPLYAADGAWLADLKPFLIPDGSMFRTSGPPALDSPAYAADFNEIKQIGSVTSTVRTADQTDAARWWHDRYVTEWEIKRQLATNQHLNTLEAARMFAMVNMTRADAAIACFSEKRAWSFWRPVTAVQLADTDGNPATEADPTWMPLLVTPPFPDYTSGHACATGANMSALTEFFHRDDIPFNAYSHDTGTRRYFTSFSQAVAEVIEARVWGGIHFRSADIAGVAIGRAVTDYTTRHYFRPLR